MTNALQVPSDQLKEYKTIHDEVEEAIFSIAPAIREIDIDIDMCRGASTSQLRSYFEDWVDQKAANGARTLKTKMEAYLNSVATTMDKGITFDEKVKTFQTIKLSYEEAGTSRLGMAIIGVKYIEPGKVDIGHAMYAEQWTEQPGVSLVQGQWPDEKIQKFLVWRLLERIPPHMKGSFLT